MTDAQTDQRQAAKDSAYNPACDPTGAYTSDGQYTTTYCDDWAKGYAATWNAKHRVQPTNPDAPSNNDNSGSATNSEGSQGNYAGICQTVQPVLLQSCDTLVNPDGSLTSAGTSALGCIRNRIVLDGGATLLGVPLHVVLAGLSILAAPTSCGGIVDMSGFNRLSNIGSIGSLLSQLP